MGHVMSQRHLLKDAWECVCIVMYRYFHLLLTLSVTDFQTFNLCATLQQASLLLSVLKEFSNSFFLWNKSYHHLTLTLKILAYFGVYVDC